MGKDPVREYARGFEDISDDYFFDKLGMSPGNIRVSENSVIFNMGPIEYNLEFENRNGSTKVRFRVELGDKVVEEEKEMNLRRGMISRKGLLDRLLAYTSYLNSE